MKLKNKLLSGVLSAAVMWVSISSVMVSAETISLDVNSDGKVNVFDWIMQKRQNGSSDRLALLRDFLLGREVNLEDNSYPIDETAILEPKGTVHYGEGTFYGGGYEGGCAMLDPVSTDIWVAAMNLEDYNNAQPHFIAAYVVDKVRKHQQSHTAIIKIQRCRDPRAQGDFHNANTDS